MAKIGCVGCSFTAATHHHRPNWVRSLAKMHTEHEFYNLATAGASVLYGIWILEEFLKTHQLDLVIFQITKEGRLTYFKDHELDQTPLETYLQKENNYNYINFPLRTVSCVNYGTLNKSPDCAHPLYEEQKNLANVYYSNVSKKRVFDVEHRALVYYVKSISDHCFYHTEDETNYKDIISIENVLGRDRFNDYIVDEGQHFGQEGADWQAKFISNLYIEGKEFK